LERAAHEGVDFLGIEARGDRGEAGDVHEQHGDLLALALDRAPRGEDLVGQVLGCVRARHHLFADAAGLVAACIPECRSALVADLVPRRIARPTGRAHGLERSAAAAAELRCVRVVVLTARAGHGRPFSPRPSLFGFRGEGGVLTLSRLVPHVIPDLLAVGGSRRYADTSPQRLDGSIDGALAWRVDLAPEASAWRPESWTIDEISDVHTSSVHTGVAEGGATAMHRRLNVPLPEETVRLIDRTV